MLTLHSNRLCIYPRSRRSNRGIRVVLDLISFLGPGVAFPCFSRTSPRFPCADSCGVNIAVGIGPSVVLYAPWFAIPRRLVQPRIPRWLTQSTAAPGSPCEPFPGLWVLPPQSCLLFLGSYLRGVCCFRKPSTGCSLIVQGLPM